MQKPDHLVKLHLPSCKVVGLHILNEVVHRRSPNSPRNRSRLRNLQDGLYCQVWSSRIDTGLHNGYMQIIVHSLINSPPGGCR